MGEKVRKINDRYLILEPLGAGGMGEVFLVEDLLHPTHAQFALKLLNLPQDSGNELISWFKREFHTLSSLRHPHIARVYDFGRDQKSQRAFYTSELIAGKDLFTATRDQSLEKQIGVLMKVSQTLDYIHTRGILHNDLKPGNILLEEQTGQPKILDFGLSHAAQPTHVEGKSTSQGLSICGTPAYMAPELILGEPASIHSDLYALGMIFYKVLAGRLPYQDKSEASMLKIIQEGSFLSPRSFNPGLDATLENLILSMLAKSPMERPKTALDVYDQLVLRQGHRSPQECAEPGAAYSEAVRLVGREREMRILKKFVSRKIPSVIHAEKTRVDSIIQPISEESISWSEESVEWVPGIALIAGEAGLGKSFLLESLKVHFQLQDLPCIVVECQHHVAPFSSWQRAIQELRGLMGEKSATLEEYGNFLEYVLADEKSDQGEFSGLDRFGFFLKLSGFINLAFKECPFVLAFDAIHAADEISAQFLWHLVRQAGLSNTLNLPPILATATNRNTDLPIQQAAQALVVELRPLTSSQCKSLLEDIFLPQKVSMEMSEVIRGRCTGNPLFIRHLIQELIASGVMIRQANRWNIEAMDLEKIPMPATLADLLQKKFTALKPIQKEILLFAALLDQPLALADFRSLLGKSSPNYRKEVEILGRMDMLRKDADERWSHSQVLFAEIVRKQSTDLQRKIRACTAFLESSPKKPLEKLATLYAELGEREVAAQYAIQAAKQAQRLFAEEHALRLFRFAFEQGSDKSSTVSIEALAGIADVLWHQGKRQESLDAFQFLLTRSSASNHLSERSLARRALGIAYRDRGEYVEARNLFQQALDESGNRDIEIQAEMSAQIAMTLQYAGDEKFATWSKSALDLAGRIKPQAGHAVAPIYILIAEIAVRGDHLVQAKRLYQQALESSEKLQDLRGCCIALMNLGVVAAKKGNFAESQSLIEKTLATARRIGDAQRTCHCLLNLGNLAYLGGAYAKAGTYLQEAYQLAFVMDSKLLIARIATVLGQLEADCGHYVLSMNHLEEAKKLRKELSDKAGLSIVYQGIANLLLYLRQNSRALKYAERALSLASSAEVKGKILLLAIRALIQLEDFPAAQAKLKECKQVLEPLAGVLVEAELLLRMGDAKAASSLLHDSKKILESAQDQTLQVHGRFLLLQAEFKEGSAGADTKVNVQGMLSTLASLKSKVVSMEKSDLQWRFYGFSAEVYESCGEIKQAIESFQQAQTLISLLGEGLTPEWRASFMLDPEKENIQSSISRLTQTYEYANQRLLELQKHNQHLDRLLEINRQLAIRWTNGVRLLEYILDTALELIKARRGFIALQKNGVLKLAASRNTDAEASWSPEKEVSNTILQKVIATGQPLSLTDAGHAPEFQESQSIMNLHLRSVVCVPLRSGSQVIGAIYLDHDQAKGLFADLPMKLLQSIADQAVIAIRQAESFAHVQNLFEETSKELSRSRAILENQTKALEWKYNYAQIIGGKDPQMIQVFKLLDLVVPTSTTVLIQGESGTGKELIARAIHYNGPRKEMPLISINCSGLNPSLIESELFGHAKGAFTGAEEKKDGLFLLANGGSLFLDEIGDMPLECQAKLLRVLQENEIQPLGGLRPIKIDVRIISASNKSLKEQCEKGAFREDLYYRINVVEVDLPPLRERKLDLDLLIDAFLTKFAGEGRKRKRLISERARAKLHLYSWPGNVRELYHVLESLTTLHPHKRIDLGDLPEMIRLAQLSPTAPTASLEDAKEIFMHDYLRNLLRDTKGNVSEAAKRAGIYRKSLYRMLQKYKVKIDKKSETAA